LKIKPRMSFLDKGEEIFGFYVGERMDSGFNSKWSIIFLFDVKRGFWEDFYKIFIGKLSWL
jgi:hypothetical protein